MPGAIRRNLADDAVWLTRSASFRPLYSPAHALQLLVLCLQLPLCPPSRRTPRRPRFRPRRCRRESRRASSRRSLQPSSRVCAPLLGAHCTRAGRRRSGLIRPSGSSPR